ncbi:conserved Plasmodium protein, unknown function [Plasmodium reichenowi]|uniref:Uncharacterized protein n=1 Tax=Plasmodium reichenowi TaxID=5854 RepID=A0A060RPF6_PLARE|nr:conserved Plasmodium protein, unknown function [Plasmodium reichenowi]
MLYSLCLLYITIAKTLSCFNFNNELQQTKYLVLKDAYINCKNYNVIDKKNEDYNIKQAELYCDEDPFCNYILYNQKKKEIRLCYDKKITLKHPKYDDTWVTSIKENVFENFSPSLINTQGICNNQVDKIFFSSLNEAIQKGKENNKQFLILNFQSKNNEYNIEGYFCESIDYFINREGYVVFDFIKREQPHQSCLKSKKCGLRGSVQSDDSKYEENINPGDVVVAHKF